MKFMNWKRIASTAMAGVMALSLAVPGLAAEKSTTITGAYKAVTLAVTVPSTGKAIINPYGLPIALDETSKVTGQQITTGAPYMVENRSEVALSVSANVIAAATGDFEFSATDPTGTDKAGHVIFQMFPAAGVTEANATDTAAVAAKFAALPDDSPDPTKDITLDDTATGGVGEDDIIVIRGANANGELQDGGAAFFRLSGTVVQKPATAWAVEDGFTAKIVFTFAPSTYKVEGGSLAADATTLNAAAGTATITLTPPTGVTVTSATWTSSETAAATVAADASDATNKTAIVTRVAAATNNPVTISVEYEGSDGNVYTASIDLTVN